ncbi:hypothetical protein [Embleya scabrispora]|uniref:hypothetical protein n=1 Tax=Embleya scabrispora TaxID=159449 RepID=UPI001180BF31|nr:hypothetical protein [Embleya scabrispora]
MGASLPLGLVLRREIAPLLHADPLVAGERELPGTVGGLPAPPPVRRAGGARGRRDHAHTEFGRYRHRPRVVHIRAELHPMQLEPGVAARRDQVGGLLERQVVLAGAKANSPLAGIVNVSSFTPSATTRGYNPRATQREATRPSDMASSAGSASSSNTAGYEGPDARTWRVVVIPREQGLSRGQRSAGPVSPMLVRVALAFQGPDGPPAG